MKTPKFKMLIVTMLLFLWLTPTVSFGPFDDPVAKLTGPHHVFGPIIGIMLLPVGTKSA